MDDDTALSGQRAVARATAWYRHSYNVQGHVWVALDERAHANGRWYVELLSEEVAYAVGVEVYPDGRRVQQVSSGMHRIAHRFPAVLLPSNAYHG